MSLQDRIARADRWRSDAHSVLVGVFWGIPGFASADVAFATRRLVRASRLLNALAVKSTAGLAR